MKYLIKKWCMQHDSYLALEMSIRLVDVVNGAMQSIISPSWETCVVHVLNIILIYQKEEKFFRMKIDTVNWIIDGKIIPLVHAVNLALRMLTQFFCSLNVEYLDMNIFTALIVQNPMMFAQSIILPSQMPVHQNVKTRESNDIQLHLLQISYYNFYMLTVHVLSFIVVWLPHLWYFH